MAVQHVNVTDPNIHEPKGAAAAASGQMYIANGSGSGAWRYMPHSSMYYANIGTGTTLTAPTSYTKIAPTTTADSSPREFTHSGTGRLTYTGTLTLDHQIHAAITMKHSAGAGVDCFFAIYKNGALAAGGEAVQTADSANYNQVSLSAHISMATDDYIEIFAKCASGNIIVHAMNISIVGRI